MFCRCKQFATYCGTEGTRFFWRSYVRMIYFLYIFDSMFCYCFVLSGWASFTFYYSRVRHHQFIVDLTFCLCFIFISKIFCYRLLLGIDLVIFVYLYMSCIYISCQCATNCARHFILNAHASIPVAHTTLCGTVFALLVPIS